jgi:outer membrane protein TolC
MKATLIILLCGLCLSGWSQDTGMTAISLDSCHILAHQNFPKTRNQALYKEVYEHKIDNIRSSWLPQMDINGQFTHQSDVISIDIPVVQIEGPSKNQFRVTLDVRQTIYDGGYASAQKEIEAKDLAINQKNIEVEFKQVKQRVNTFYFMVLIYQETEKQLQITLEELEKRLSMVQSGVENGVLLPVEADKLKAEMLRLEQGISEVRHNRNAGINMLSRLIGEPLSADINLEIPETEFTGSSEAISPEIALADLQIEKVRSNNQLLTTKRLPKFWAFGLYGIGKPSLNVLEDQLGDLYILGLGMTWNIWDWNITSRERDMLVLQEKMIENQKESIEISQDLEQTQEEANIIKYRELIKNDLEIIELQQRVRETATSQFNNGVITSSDYLREVSAETQARIRLEVHKIQLEQAKLNYITIKGE